MKIRVSTSCAATVTEVWTLTVSDDEAREAIADETFALELLDGDHIEDVENVDVFDEQDREIVRVSVVEP